MNWTQLDLANFRADFEYWNSCITVWILNSLTPSTSRVLNFGSYRSPVFFKREALSILDNYIKLIQLCKIQPDLYITRMHTTNKKTKRERYDKKSCRSKLQHATSPSALHNYSSTWAMKYTPKDNASNEETARARTVIAVTQPIKVRSKVFTQGSHSSESKQCLQYGHCQVQPVKVRYGNFFPEPMWSAPTRRSRLNHVLITE